MRVMGGGGLEVSHPPWDARSGDASCCGVLSGGSAVCAVCAVWLLWCVWRL